MVIEIGLLHSLNINNRCTCQFQKENNIRKKIMDSVFIL